MKYIRIEDREDAARLLQRLVGRYVLLNVSVDGSATSICINVERGGSAAWRKKEDRRRRSLSLSSPSFSLTDRTLVLNYEDVNKLANNFHSIREAVPAAAVGPDGNVALGNLPRDGADMGSLLAGLERRSADILAVCNSLELSLDTGLLSLRRSLPHSVVLMEDGGLSDYANSVLHAFSESQTIYALLPQLRGFGTGNAGRGQDLPSKRDARLRFYMQLKRDNPLRTSRPVNFVAYELKPLNISSGLRWNCASDPRTESVDLLLELSGSPVFTEVKMAGDKLVSSAVVQLLYYASVLANDKQRARLAREFDCFTTQEPWLCVIAEQREDAGFADDLAAAVSFLKHAETRRTLAPFFCGAVILSIRENPEPFCSVGGIPSFQTVENGEHFVEWRR